MSLTCTLFPLRRFFHFVFFLNLGSVCNVGCSLSSSQAKARTISITRLYCFRYSNNKVFANTILPGSIIQNVSVSLSCAGI